MAEKSPQKPQTEIGRLEGAAINRCTSRPGKSPTGESIPKLAEGSLEALRDLYRHDLFDDFLPFLERHVIDPVHGGFLCHTDRAGNQISTRKTTRDEGRGIWVYSFLYNHLAREGKYLEVARKSADFVLPHRPGEGDLWPGSFTREGVPSDEGKRDIYGGLFVANGLVQYARASGDDRYWSIARDILTSHMALYDRPDYSCTLHYGPDLVPFAGPRVLGHWMVLLRLATQMLQARDDPQVEEIAGRCVEAIMERHFNPEFGLLNEVLHHDLSRPTNGMEQFCYTGHAIETLWMVLFEAERRYDRGLQERATEMFRRHVELAWDEAHGGFFRSLDHIEKRTWKTDKVLWLQEEVLIGTMFLVEQTADAWARRWFDRTYRYVREKFPLERYGYSLWMLDGDREVTFVEKATRVGNFHHPRHLMLNLLSLDRLIQRGEAPL